MSEQSESTDIEDHDQTASSPEDSRSGEILPKIPPADFSLLVSMFSTQAMVALGLIPEPGTGKPQTQLHLARHFIDLLGVLEEKTKGNLTEKETSGLSENLHYLRMLYLKQSQGK